MNHLISKRIMTEAERMLRGIALEDLGESGGQDVSEAGRMVNLFHLLAAKSRGENWHAFTSIELVVARQVTVALTARLCAQPFLGRPSRPSRRTTS
ncbi:hypothetical protein HNP84_006980 [Thermocatellispora tengchongensis]|uniref:Uncharacterized protein n=1 Tax=Thermocatellispora tengchongensis TaxID=1073253 RepID=A0A840PC66_9ACTN|nr:hypothetical protein [Thermocatellispora tengchongensis]MBB5137228.1 hypothetical protein [Thermocatellispora tengchongensis]